MKKLIHQLDGYFSKFIRQRDADENGIVKCFTCETRNHWKEMDCGHFQKRQHMATRYDEINCQTQCKDCNWLKQGNDEVFARNLEREYGYGTVERLKIKSRNKSKLDRFALTMLIKQYKELLKNKS